MLNKRLNVPPEHGPQSYQPIFEEPTGKGFDADNFTDPAAKDYINKADPTKESSTENRRPEVDDKRPSIPRPDKEPVRKSSRTRKSPKNISIKAFDNAKSYYHARMNNNWDPKIHVPIMINNTEHAHIGGSGEEYDNDTPHPIHDEKLPDRLSDFTSQQLDNFRYYHLCDYWSNDQDRDWMPICVQNTP